MTPMWLTQSFALLMLVVAGYCVLRIAVSLFIKEPSGWDVDLAHALMGVSMAGMFEPSVAFGSALFWRVIFSILTLWFLARSLQAMRDYGAHLSHFVIHALMSFVMVLMYWFPQSMEAAGRGSAMASSMGSAARRPDAGLLVLLAVTLLASAVRSMGSARRGISHYGTHMPIPAIAAHHDGCRCSDCGGGSVEDRELVRLEAVVMSPALGDATHVIMCISMAFMLIVMV